ncbi:MAG: hypothetical protein WCJ35_09265 [Planctomycetota bacterium]
MTEPQKTDHWASLATNLGAERVPEEPRDLASVETPESAAEEPTEQVAPPLPAFRPAAKPAPAPRRPARASAWDQLAGDLGIAPPPPSPLAPPAPPAPPAATTTQPFAEPRKVVVELELALPAWGELELPAIEPGSYEPQEALDIMDETADEFDAEESEESATTPDSANEQSANEEGATDERRPRRRRRRRGRGRSREGVLSDEAQTANEPGEELANEEGVLSESTESDVDNSVQEPAEKDRIEGEQPERRGRRRRRGRGRGRDRDQVRDEQTVGKESAEDDDEFAFDGAEEDSVNAEVSDEHDEHDDEHDEYVEHDDDGEHDEDGEHDDDGEHDEDGGESPRIGFRNISTWQDAIGAIIAKNMESRARNPGGSRGSGGRGGRGRRPDRR